MAVQIQEKSQIKQVMHAYLHEPDKQCAPFLVSIKVSKGFKWNGSVAPAGVVIEGARPLSACTHADGDVTYSLTNSDSGYARSIGHVKLSALESIETLQC